MSAFSFYGRYRRVTLSAGLTRLERDLFFNSRMKELVIPASVTSIGHEALVSYENSLEKIMCKAMNPPSIEDNTFTDETLKSASLYVPFGAINAYKKDNKWGKFNTILGIPGTEASSESSSGSSTPTPAVGIGENFEVDGIRYWVKDAHTVYVTDKPKVGYAGEVVIPATVQKDGVTYKVKKVGNYTFKNSRGLTAVTLPASIEEVKKESFVGCMALNKITCLATTPPAVMEKAISAELAQRATLVVPQTAIGQYANAEGWKTFKKFEGM